MLKIFLILGLLAAVGAQKHEVMYNLHDDCDNWASEDNQCVENPSFMWSSCLASCVEYARDVEELVVVLVYPFSYSFSLLFSFSSLRTLSLTLSISSSLIFVTKKLSRLGGGGRMHEQSELYQHPLPAIVQLCHRLEPHLAK